MLSSPALFRNMILEAQRAQIRQRRQELALGTISSQASPEQTVVYLIQQPAVGGKTLADLLISVAETQKRLEIANFKEQEDAYNALYWFQRLYSPPPNRATSRLKDFPLKELERCHGSQGERVQLFCALCELHERGLVKLDTQHPYRVGMTSRGRGLMPLLKQRNQLPAYEDVVLPPVEVRY